MIDTAKHHFISGMAGTDKNYPIREWDRGAAQSQRTLNMLRPCKINPKLSADAFLEGQQDYNAVTFPPLGGRMLIFEGPEKRSSWGFHGVEGFSVGPAEKLQMLQGMGPNDRGRNNIRYSSILPTKKIYI